MPRRYLKLQLLTGARCGEISGLCAEEIDREQWNWTLPAARSKNKRPRVTPLVGMARRIIEARLSTVQSGPLFTAETGTSSDRRQTSATTCWRGATSCRSTSSPRTICGAPWRPCWRKWAWPLDLVAAVVGHEAGGKETRTLVRHYVRTDLIERKIHVLRAWDERLQGIIDRPRGRERHPISNRSGDRRSNFADRAFAVALAQP